MKKTLTPVLIAVSAALLVPALARAYGAAGIVGAPYLELPMGARGEGMGEAFTGISDDINAIYYNPAGLTNLDTAQINLMHVESFGGVQYENIGIATPANLLGVNVWSTLALNYTLVGIDNTPLTLETPGGAYEATPYFFTAGASVLTLSYAWQATQMFSVGANLKAINEKVATSQGWGVAGDVGILTRPGLFGGLNAGADLQNFGTSPEPYSTLPTLLRLGLGYDCADLFGPYDQVDKLLFDMDWVMPVVPVDQEWQLDLGTEYTRSFGHEFGSLRLGYRFPETVLGAEAGMSVGAGVGTVVEGLDLSVDYSWVPYGILGSEQRVALTASFGEPSRRKIEEAKGDYLYPPQDVVVQAGDHSARLSWKAQKGKVDGYDIYMSYKPKSGKWIRLNRAPITTTSMVIRDLYRGYKVYFAVSTLRHKTQRIYKESEKSPPRMVTPY